MQVDDQRAYWLEIAGLTVAAVLLFRFGLLGLVFLVPVQLIWLRRGEEAGTLASAGVILGIGVFKWVDYLRLRRTIGPDELPASLLLLDLVFAAGLLAGLFMMNSDRLTVADPASETGRRTMTVPERMIAAVAAGAAIYGPTIGLLVTGDAAESAIAMQIELMRPLFEAAGAGSDEITMLVRIVVSAILSGLMFGFFVMVTGNWWLGVQIAFKSRFSLPAGNAVMARHAGYELTEFKLPEYLVWALIGAWGGVLLSMVAELGWVSYLFWNAAFVTLALYGVQGIAIVWFYLDRRKVQRITRIGVAVGMVIGLLIPGLRFVVGVGLPGLGVSELWINYHRARGSEDVS